MNDLNNFIDFSDLASTDAEIAAAKTKRDTTQRFPCGECAGTGKYSGARVHQEKSHCFACRGLGYFKTDPRKLAAKRARKENRKMVAKQDVIERLKLAQPELFAELDQAYRIHEGNDFIASLAEQVFGQGRFLTPNQINAWHRGNEKRKASIAARQTAQVQVDLAAIRNMFETAVSSGYKRPKYRAEGLVINRAPDTGNNPGALYVKNEDDVYLGKILGTTFSPNRDGIAAKAADVLTLIATDPLEAALRYGQRTGRCACCGRELTKHTSIDLGIGPVCREKWGL